MKSPRVLKREVSADTARFELAVPAALDWFEGHFPGHPILPGVVQLHWVDELARAVFDGLAPFAGLRTVKFHRLVGPDSRLALVIRRTENHLDWSYREADAPDVVVSEGRMRLREAE